MRRESHPDVGSGREKEATDDVDDVAGDQDQEEKDRLEVVTLMCC